MPCLSRRRGREEARSPSRPLLAIIFFAWESRRVRETRRSALIQLIHIWDDSLLTINAFNPSLPDLGALFPFDVLEFATFLPSTQTPKPLGARTRVVSPTRAVKSAIEERSLRVWTRWKWEEGKGRESAEVLVEVGE